MQPGEFSNVLVDESTIPLLLGAGIVVFVVLLLITIVNKNCRMWALGALVLVLGFLAYLGHKEQIEQFANHASTIINYGAKHKFSEALKKAAVPGE